MANNQMLFGNGIKRRREELGISQEELAELAKLHRTYISDIERGKRNISLQNLISLIHSLDLSISDFFEEYATALDKVKN